MSRDLPTTRWQQAGERRFGYADRFGELIDSGQDVDGEARLADALLPRGARVLDAGAGIGRVGEALRLRGHDVVAIEPDQDMVDIGRRRFPSLDLRSLDVLEVDAAIGPFDLIVCVGNVMILLAPDTEVRALRAMSSALRPGGRILVGFHTTAGPAHSRAYSPAEFLADVEVAGLAVQHRFSSYELGPVGPQDGRDDDYVVAVLTRA